MAPGEVARRLDSLSRDVRALGDRLDQLPTQRQLELMGTGWASALDATAQRMEDRYRDVRGDVDELKSWQTWAMRLVLGFVALAVLGLAIGTSSGQA